MRLKAALDSDEEIDFSVPLATHWPECRSSESEWNELKRWVDALRERFSSLDHHVIPNCWYKHNSHVEVLCALRDHERSSYSDSAPATAPTDWFRALRDMEQLLRTWTKESPCGSVHDEVTVLKTDEKSFTAWVETTASAF